MRSKISLSVLLALSLVGIAAARADDDDPAKGHFTLEEATKGLSGSGPLTAKIDTTLGAFTCELYDKQAPVTVANFVGLAEGTIANAAFDPGQPFFDGGGNRGDLVLSRISHPKFGTNATSAALGREPERQRAAQPVRFGIGDHG